MSLAIVSSCRRYCTWLLLLCLFAGVVPLLAQQSQTAAKAPPPPKWPMIFEKDGTRLVIYQPQLRSWQKFRDLTSDTAVALTPSGGKPVLGVVSWHATTMADTTTRLVVIKDIDLASARFPALAAGETPAMERLVRATYPRDSMIISLDRMLAGFKALQAPPAHPTLNTQPPPIMVSTTPAVLLFVDGEAIRVPIEGTHLEYVVNTNWDLLYDKTDYYLLVDKTWLKARQLAGPWAVTTQLPADMSKLPAGQNWDDVRQAVPPPPGAAAVRVVFTAKPAELLMFKGEPTYSKISGTKLAYATNTDQDVFWYKPDGQVYILVSGRWFRASTLQGPWSFASADLPADFAKIPPNHPRAHVLVSVPGTQAAQDAVLLAQVPTTAIINRAEAEAKAKVTYSGEPQFKPIEGTSLSYAVNTGERVLKVGDLYYLCLQAVWFVSTGPNGPWKTADSVPKEIYEIPPASPVYNVTYVTVSNPTTTTVESSHTEGYLGAFVLGAAVGACIVYGTGYYYPPYYYPYPYVYPYPYPIYHPYPYTYGYGAWYNPTTGRYGYGGAVYGPYGAAGGAAWYNPSTGTYGRAATVQTPYGGRTVAQAYNPYTGGYAATAQGHNPYAQWGTSVATRGDDWVRTGHISTDQGTAFHYKTSDGGSGTIIHGPDGAAGIVKTPDNDIYAGKDGNLYKHDENGWSKYDDGNWNPVDPKSKDTTQAKERTQAKDSAQAKGRTTGGEDSVYKGRQEGTTTGQQQTGRTPDSASQARQERQGMTPSERSADLQQRAAGARESGAQAGQRQAPVTQAAGREPGSWQSGARQTSISPETRGQLNRDAAARQQGAWHEQARSRSYGGGFSGGARMGGRRR